MGDEEGGAAMSSNVQEDILLGLFGDSPSSSGSATLKPDSPKIAGGEKKADKKRKGIGHSSKKGNGGRESAY